MSIYVVALEFFQPVHCERICWFKSKFKVFFENSSRSVISLQKIHEYQDLKDEISLLRISVPLSMFTLDCAVLNENLAVRAQKLRARLVLFVVEDNRSLNRGYGVTLKRVYSDLSLTVHSTKVPSLKWQKM